MLSFPHGIRQAFLRPVWAPFRRCLPSPALLQISFPEDGDSDCLLPDQSKEKATFLLPPINADDAGSLLPMKSGEKDNCLQPSLIEGEGLLPTNAHPIFTLHPLPARVMMGILSPVSLIQCASSLPECQPASQNGCGFLQLRNDIEGIHANPRVNPKVKMKPKLPHHIISLSNVNLAKLDEVARISGFHFLIPLRGRTSNQWNDEATNEDAMAYPHQRTNPLLYLYIQSCDTPPSFIASSSNLFNYVSLSYADQDDHYFQGAYTRISLPFIPLRGRMGYQAHERQSKVKMKDSPQSKMKQKKQMIEMGLNYMKKDLLDPG